MINYNGNEGENEKKITQIRHKENQARHGYEYTTLQNVSQYDDRYSQ